MVGLFDAVFQHYIGNNVLPNDRSNSGPRNLQYQTEASDELGQDQLDENNNNDK
ncbi:MULTISPECIES: hypothetical protein [Oceanobacillus]|uniref:hypothetical protein n=1 Tax=Oceanobacillus TaxID=182709 RepID=UPI001438A451|nr:MULTISPECIES: hypothetical protein [Oceanobacillus]